MMRQHTASLFSASTAAAPRRWRRFAAAGRQHDTSALVGPANVSTDFDATAIERIRVAALAQRAQPERPAGPDADGARGPAFVGLAGVTGPTAAMPRVAAIAVRHARIADDRPAALRGALGDTTARSPPSAPARSSAAQHGDDRAARRLGLRARRRGLGAWLGRALLERTLLRMTGWIGATSPLTGARWPISTAPPSVVRVRGRRAARRFRRPLPRDGRRRRAGGRRDRAAR